MLAAKTVAEIQRLLDLKTHSQRRIAALLGVSRGSVAAIALGRRRDVPADASDDAPAGTVRSARAMSRLRRIGVYAVPVVPPAEGKPPRSATADGRLPDVAAFGSPARTPRAIRRSPGMAAEDDQQTTSEHDHERTDSHTLRRRARRDSRRRSAAVSPTRSANAADRRGGPVAVRPCRDRRLVERSADVRRNDLGRRAGAAPVEHRRDAGPASSTCTRRTPRGDVFRGGGPCWP